MESSLKSFMDSIKESFAKSKAERRAKTHTYIIQDTSTGFYKIGKSIDPERRVRQLKVANCNLKLYATLHGDCEHKIHKDFERNKVSGEWFKLSPYELEIIITSNHFNLC